MAKRRLTRFSLKFSGGSTSQQQEARQEESDSEWYIPYNGPYEPPPGSGRDGERKRDSWGSMMALAPNSAPASQTSSARGDDGQVEPNPFRARGATISHPSTSSSSSTSRYNSHSRARTTPTHLLDAAGGIGETPIPIQRNLRAPGQQATPSLTGGARERRPSGASLTGSHRMGFAGLLGLGGGGKQESRQQEAVKHHPYATAKSPIADGEARQMKHAGHQDSSSSSSGSTSASSDHHQQTQADYYNSYYSTLISTPKASRSVLVKKRARHPYAYDASSGNVPALSGDADPPRVRVTAPSGSSLDTSSLPVVPRLRSSMSTPNLHQTPSSDSQAPPTRHGEIGSINSSPIPGFLHTPKSHSTFSLVRERWLHPETWCDALILPRPRLRIVGLLDKEKALPSRVLVHSQSLDNVGSGKKLPLASWFAERRLSTVPDQDDQPEQEKPQPKRKSFALDDMALPSPVPTLVRVLAEGEILQHQRRKWQDQAKHSFQNQRSRSLSRSRAKSLVRRQVKQKDNVDNDDNISWPRAQSNLDFLAARSLLGNQDDTPVMGRKPADTQRGTSRGRPSVSKTDSAGRPSHSHHNSLTKTLSKSSKGQKTHTHVRNDSWSKSALRIAKTATSATICGVRMSDDEDLDDDMIHLNKRSALDGALDGDGTRVIRLADPALIPVDKGNTLEALSPEPTYEYTASSAGHGEGVGIAISTPSPEELDMDSIRMPAHPYAQQLVYNYQHPPIRTEQRHDPTPRPPPPPPAPLGSENTVDLTEPPPRSWHPYAQLSARDSYDPRIIAQPRPDSHVPPQSTMWAPLSTGVVREILPYEIQYSPVSPDTRVSSAANMDAYPSRNELLHNSRMIYDRVGLGETLAQAVQQQQQHQQQQTEEWDHRDSGVGTSEDYAALGPQTSVPAAAHGDYNQANTTASRTGPVSAGDGENPRVSAVGTYTSTSSRREPVQYDASRPVYRHTEAPTSTPVESPVFRRPDARPSPIATGQGKVKADPDTANDPTSPLTAASPGVTSTSSSPLPSPRPLGNMDDLDNDRFRDLFYRPDSYSYSYSGRQRQQSPSSASGPGVPWDVTSRHRTASSGLTSLARQLTEEWEELRVLTESSDSSPSGSLRQSTGSRPLTTSNLHFVLSADDASQMTSPTMGMEISEEPRSSGEQDVAQQHASLAVFKATSPAIPEDVASSRASSFLGDDPTERFRLGVVEAVSTPPSTDNNDRRFSEHLSYVDPEEEDNDDTITNLNLALPLTSPNPDSARITSTSSLHPPSTILTRTSYMTTSTDGSRMSGLSDFPVPPLQEHMTPGNMSIINSYFEERRAEAASSQAQTSRQSTFGADDELDFAMALEARPSARQA